MYIYYYINYNLEYWIELTNVLPLLEWDWDVSRIIKDFYVLLRYLVLEKFLSHKYIDVVVGLGG